jgi:uncharacterized SAM-binding protein YcdF (DUF218 family)
MRKKFLWFEIIICLPLLVWFFGFVAFMVEINSPSVASRRDKADAIVVLTGSGERLHIGLMLLEEGVGKELFITGVGGGAELLNIYPGEGQATRLKKLKEHIVLENRATDTETNAQETAKWLKERDYHSIRLVTSNYHMPRAMVEFRRFLPPEVKILMHPIMGIDMPGESPVLERRVAYFLFKEYNKFLIAYLRAKTENILPIWS